MIPISITTMQSMSLSKGEDREHGLTSVWLSLAVAGNMNGNHTPFDSYGEWNFERWGVCQGELSSLVMMDLDREAGSVGMRKQRALRHYNIYRIILKL